MALPSVRNHHTSGDAPQDRLDELDRLNRRLATLVESWARLPELLHGRSSPLADVEETDDGYVVEIELPGVDRDDIDIEIAGRQLFVHAERKEKQRVGILRRRERTIGEFTYEVMLPGALRDDAIEATMEAGVLTVRVPKPEHEKRRRIPIQMQPQP
ncbi:MAG TPA: Hsp20/alpha crystallin family protein [Acidimicrobiales bacterium]|nr:Hsp20/alpha crystallin family protein [Acidimicrobiales bacterium]